MPVNLLSAGGGTTTLTTASSASNFTLTLPATTGTVALTSQIPVAGTGPAFYAYNFTPTLINNGTETKIPYDTEAYDTASCYNTSTYRFTPNVAGYYQVTAALRYNASVSSRFQINIWKSGSSAFRGSDFNGANTYSVACCALIYLNGSTDYIEAYVYQDGSSQTVTNGVQYTYFQACLVRSA